MEQHHNHEHGIVSKLGKYIKPKKGSFFYRLAKNEKIVDFIKLLNNIEGVSHTYAAISALLILIFSLYTLSWWAITLLVFGILLDAFFGGVSFFTSYCMEVAKQESKEKENVDKSE